jgi:hypothetical protein
VKHFIHLISAVALFLGTLLILDLQKSGEESPQAPALDIGSMQLLADIPGNHGAVFCFTSGWHRLVTVFESISGKLNHRAFLIVQALVSRSKSQLQIHLELKPLLMIRSGPRLSLADRYDDPPHCRV